MNSSFTVLFAVFLAIKNNKKTKLEKCNPKVNVSAWNFANKHVEVVVGLLY